MNAAVITIFVIAISSSPFWHSEHSETLGGADQPACSLWRTQSVTSRATSVTRKI